MKSLLGGVLDLVENRAPVPYAPPPRTLFGLGQSRNLGREMEAMEAVGTLFSIVSTLANSTAMAPWSLYRKRLPRADPNAPRVPVQRHAALDLWRKPNPFFTGQELVESVQQHVDLVGEGYIVVVRDVRATFPVELWPVRPDRMTPVPHPVDYLTGWIYTGPNGESVPLDVADVIQLRMPNPRDPYRGLGPVQSILADLDAAKFSAEWNRNFFRNDAKPGGIIQVEGTLGDTEFDRLRAQWADDHQGVNNAHRVAILEGGATWKERQYTQEDMQFVGLRNLSRDVMREAFGVAKTMLGQTEEVNRATAEAAEMVFAKWKLVPRLERFKQALNNDLLPMFGSTSEAVEFDYDADIPEDEVAEAAERTSKATGAATLVGAGFHPDDVCRAMGLPIMRFERRDPVATPPAPPHGEASSSAA